MYEGNNTKKRGLWLEIFEGVRSRYFDVIDPSANSKGEIRDPWKFPGVLLYHGSIRRCFLINQQNNTFFFEMEAPDLHHRLINRKRIAQVIDKKRTKTITTCPHANYSQSMNLHDHLTRQTNTLSHNNHKAQANGSQHRKRTTIESISTSTSDATT